MKEAAVSTASECFRRTEKYYRLELRAGACELEWLLPVPELLLRLLPRFPLCETTPDEEGREADFMREEPDDPDLLADRSETEVDDLRELPELPNEGSDADLLLTSFSGLLSGEVEILLLPSGALLPPETSLLRPEDVTVPGRCV